MKPKWEIRTERDVGFFGINLKPGKETHAGEPCMRVKYRKHGSRGRFRSFVIVGAIPTSIPELVDAYEAKLASWKPGG